mgnify:CR=1 FL=1
MWVRLQVLRLKVNIAHNAVFSHHIIELVAVLIISADKSDKVQMTAAPVVFVTMIEHLNRQILKFLVINSTITYSLAKPQDIPKVTVTSEQRKALKEAIFNQVAE